MKAPDKIYVELCSDGVYSHEKKWEGSHNIEYIRKDALLEWAREKYEEYHDRREMFAFGELIDKLNSL